MLALAALGGALAGCGGGSQATAGEPSRSFDVKIAAASFPARQSVAKPAVMRVVVRNTSGHRIPDVAATVDSFNYTSNFPGLAASKRPVWVIERGPGKPAASPVESQEVSPPGGGQTAYVNTWALGPLASGQQREFNWRVVAVKGGHYTVHFAISAGLAGRARARLASGGPASGSFQVTVAPAPPETHVDPATGKVVQGAYPPASSSK